MTTKLKPCPFCGYADCMIGRDWQNDYVAFCLGCDAQIAASIRDTVIDRWNRRYASPELQEMTGASMSIELKPCPFCGGSASLYRREYQVPVHGYDEEWFIECESQCDLEMCEYAQSDVVAAWNTRHNEMSDGDRDILEAVKNSPTLWPMVAATLALKHRDTTD